MLLKDDSLLNDKNPYMEVSAISNFKTRTDVVGVKTCQNKSE